jgi:hypothetical protein
VSVSILHAVVADSVEVLVAVTTDPVMDRPQLVVAMREGLLDVLPGPVVVMPLKGLPLMADETGPLRLSAHPIHPS